MPHVTSAGADLYYERSGHGPSLLFILGSNSTLDDMSLLADQLALHFDLVVADHRGLGRSGPVTAPYAMADCAADALAVMDDVGWPSCRVAGISFGGMVAQELAVTRPDRIDRLALLCTSAGGAGGSSYPLHQLEDLPGSERDATLVQLLDTRFDDRWLASHPADRNLLHLMAARRGPEREPGRGVAEQFAARSHHDVWDRLSAITCPTLVASGRYDGIAPMANGEAIASRIARADFRVYEGGHLFVAQDPDALPDVMAFLS
jgi:pimeloyl-ACP methyl ester carboxylesterase